MTKDLNNTSFLSGSAEHPEIYVVCLDSYNDGNVYGIWIDATQSVENILKRISTMQYEGYYPEPEMLSDGYCPDPETYGIHCHKGFYDIKIYVNDDLENVRAYALFIAQYGELGAELISNNNGNLEKAKRFMDECYLGAYESRAAYATELFNQYYLPRIPEDLQFCINCDCVKEAVFIRQGFSVEAGGKTHVFAYLKKPEFF
ncbi:MAG TPA: antirestriction protein ArdA [Gammaproteobacteria bacterium]|nr:antirestriction protein ArdA [Gammaproteobacteria bacterium]